MDQEKIGKFIKEIRKQNNLTQKGLASKYGVTYQAVSKWENGKNMPDVSLIKQMSKDFNVDIEDILEGEFKTKKRSKKLFLTIPFILILIFALFLLLKDDDNFSFKTLSSQCASFELTGSIAYNDKKSSIYISNIDYCGSKDETLYKKIECTLYESNNDKETVISKYTYNKEPITIEDFVKDLNFKVDDYSKTCKKYTKDSLYLRLEMVDTNGDIKSHKIPLSLDENCD